MVGNEVVFLGEADDFLSEGGVPLEVFGEVGECVFGGFEGGILVVHEVNEKRYLKKFLFLLIVADDFP